MTYLASYNKAYQIPLNEEVIDEGLMREYSNWLRERMQIYPSGAALAAHMPDLIPEHAVHALIDRFAESFPNLEKLTKDIAQCSWRLPPQDKVLENRTLVPRPWVPRSARQQPPLGPVRDAVGPQWPLAFCEHVRNEALSKRGMQ
jgi:hypothetical protein